MKEKGVTLAINKIKEVYLKMMKAYAKGKIKKGHKLERKLILLQLKVV